MGGFFMAKTKCTRHRNCDAEGRLFKLSGTRTADAECGDDKQCTCAGNGVGARGIKCPAHNTAYCGACDDSHWLRNGECRPRTNCNSNGKIELKYATATSDAECGREKFCSCEFGEGATGRSCSVDNMEYCVACLPEYVLQGGKCIFAPTITTETLLRTTTTEVAQTTAKPPMTTIVGIAVPGLLLLLIRLIGIGVGIYHGIRS